MSEHDPKWDDEALLAWLLDEASRAGHPRAELERDARRAARLAEVEAFLTDCREELRAESREPEPESLRELERRVLRRTTREDVSWRGDLRLVGGFLRTRLRSSVLLRVVAASLLVHLAALPVLAYFGWIAPEPTPRIAFELPTGREGELPYREVEPDAAQLPVEAPGEGLSEEAALDSLSTDGEAERLWREHLKRHGLVDLHGFSGGPRVFEAWASELGLVLYCETLLDRREASASVGRGRHEPQLEFALDHLRSWLSRSSAAGADGALDVLAASAWLRAREAGAGAADAELSARCRSWLAPRLAPGELFLRGAAWRAAFERAR